MKHFVRLFLFGLVVLSSGYLRAWCQAPAPATPEPNGQMSEGPGPGTFKLQVTAREVVVDVIALDSHQYPVKDLKQDEISVFEVTKKTKTQRHIAGMRAVDPLVDDDEVESNPGGFRISLAGTCAISQRFHYRIGYQPSSDGWKGGFHEIAVKTTRPKVTLSYRHRYYVGETNETDKPKVKGDANEAEELRLAACFHSATPPTIALKAKSIANGGGSSLKYSLIVQPDSLALTSMSEQARKVALDYGACTFDQTGKPLQYSHISAEKSLTQKEYDEVLEKGYPNTLQLPLTGAPALARLVVRDRSTGNIGWINVDTGVGVKIDAKATDGVQSNEGALTSFGSIGKASDSLCGDVYELPTGTRYLPDYLSMESIGEVFSHALNVPHHFDAEGILGLTLKPEWFGVDYYGKFWVTKPGAYSFRVYSDDGAQIWIDDRKLADDDGVHDVSEKDGTVTLAEGMHTIHIPYFEETNWVALTLEVKAPGEKYKVFDLREWSKPTGTKVAETQKPPAP